MSFHGGSKGKATYQVESMYLGHVGKVRFFGEAPPPPPPPPPPPLGDANRKFPGISLAR